MTGSDHIATSRTPEEDGMVGSEARSLDDLADEIAELSAHIDAATWSLLKAIAEFDRRGGWNGGFLSCDVSGLTVTHGTDGDALHVGRRSRKVSLPLWRALVIRDRMCQFPGCGRTRHLVTHHIRHWAEGGETEPGNLILLCRAHHWAVHEGGCRVEARPPRGLVFRRFDGRILPMCPAPTTLSEDPVQALKTCHGTLGLEEEMYRSDTLVIQGTRMFRMLIGMLILYLTHAACEI